ncbi:hypothetical protein F0P96_04825 [Hymenobacter busanensis]|uniref:Uncharacterized protein n=1 Tax=Hymenobacter busanensis TaxID=2607656 RepID=A0A7L5A1P9_9BACT|nr:hypothetical protein [Hymenobacter busanensis]KAA9338174.1 hypothetical protein F0P96_04825 [Hymenobacter busanensis]QHJ09401.1 hypothetical protein GUY19_19785 [Hymenobacter busanensis]
MNNEKAAPSNSESSGANRVGVANSGQNEFPLKKDAKPSTDGNTPSAGSQESDTAKRTGRGSQQDENQGSNQ